MLISSSTKTKSESFALKTFGLLKTLPDCDRFDAFAAQKKAGNRKKINIDLNENECHKKRLKFTTWPIKHKHN